MIKLLGLCNTPEYGAEDHFIYVATIDRALLDVIWNAQQAIRDIDQGYAVEIWDSESLTVYPGLPESLEDYVIVAEDKEEIENLYTQALCPETAIAVPMLRCTPNQFLWTWQPQKSGNTGECFTATFSLKYCDGLLCEHTQSAI